MVVKNKQVFSKTKDQAEQINSNPARLESKGTYINDTEVEVASPFDMQSFDFEATDRHQMENKSQRNEKRFGASSTLQQRHSRMQPQVDDMDNSSVNQLIMTQHDDSGINCNQDSSLPSVKLSIA